MINVDFLKIMLVMVMLVMVRSVDYGQCGLSLDHVGDGQVCLDGEEREY